MPPEFVLGPNAAVISALASGLLYVSHQTLLVRVGTSRLCLSAFRTPVARECGQIVVAGVRKPAQLRTHAPQQTAPSFNDLVSAAKQREREADSKRLGSLDVDDQLDFRWLDHGQIARIRTLENPTGIHGNLTIQIGQAAAVAPQAPEHHELTLRKDCRQHVVSR